MGENIMYTCMCNWVPMLYNGGKESLLGEITIKNKFKKIVHSSQRVETT